MDKTLKDLAEYLGGTVVGDENVVVTGLGSLDDAGPSQITFLANPKYAAKVASTRAGAVVLAPGDETHGRNCVVVDNPYLAFAKLLTLFAVRPFRGRGVLPGAIIGENVRMGNDITIHPGAVVGDNVTLGERVTLHPGAVVYEGVVVGDDVTLHANVSVREGCRIGNRVTLHNGVVVGSDGFGYAPNGREYFKIPQVGIVIIEDDVEVGANATIDRAALTVTRIGRGTKIDNLVQIAHNCDIGENCIIVAQVGLAGSVKIGEHVTLGGQSAIAGHLEVGKDTMVGGRAGVTKNIPPGSMVSGLPAIPHREWLKASMAFGKLPELRKKVTELEVKVQELSEKSSAGLESSDQEE